MFNTSLVNKRRNVIKHITTFHIENFGLTLYLHNIEVVQIKFVNSSENLNTAKRTLCNDAIIKSRNRHENIRSVWNADEHKKHSSDDSKLMKIFIKIQHGHELVLTCKIFRSQ